MKRTPRRDEAGAGFEPAHNCFADSCVSSSPSGRSEMFSGVIISFSITTPPLHGNGENGGKKGKDDYLPFFFTVIFFGLASAAFANETETTPFSISALGSFLA